MTPSLARASLSLRLNRGQSEEALAWQHEIEVALARVHRALNIWQGLETVGVTAVPPCCARARGVLCCCWRFPRACARRGSSERARFARRRAAGPRCSIQAQWGDSFTRKRLAHGCTGSSPKTTAHQAATRSSPSREDRDARARVADDRAAVDRPRRRPHAQVGAPDAPRYRVHVDAGAVAEALALLHDWAVRRILLEGDVDGGHLCGRVDEREADACVVLWS